MATARLRKSFAYPDSDNDSEPEGIDEQEQEELISNLLKADTEKTENYKRAFLVLPVLSVVLYVPTLTSATALTHLLAITSLLSSAYGLWILPTQASDTVPKAKYFPVISAEEASPLKRYLDHLNGGLCVILAMAALRAKQREAQDEVWLALLPALEFLLLYFARMQLRPVDIKELEKLRYGYKGA